MDLIKTLNEYFDTVEESLNSVENINWQGSSNELIGCFQVGNNKYRIECIKQIGNNYTYTFSYFINDEWSYELTNLGIGGFSVLSTVIYGMDHLYNKYCPNSIIFSTIDDSDTRKRLYRSHCDRFCKKNNYKLSNRGDSKNLLFVLFKDNISETEKEEIFDSSKKIIEQGK
jgi:hypothetical protein